MSDRIIVLIEDSPSGAGRRFVQAARRFGLTPVMLSHDPCRIAYLDAEAVSAIRVDTRDREAVINICEQVNESSEIAGITTPSESLYATAATACRHFGLPGPDPDAIERCRDKFAQRQLLARAGVPTPAYRLARNASDARKQATEIGLPVIVKPVLGTSSSGVKLCIDLDQVGAQTEFLLAGKHGLPPRPAVLVEEFAVGPFCTVSTIGSEIAAVVAADFSELPYFAMREFTVPAALTSDDYDRVTSIAQRSLQALALTWGPANTEIRLTRRGPVVIEVNPRIVGAPEPELIRLAHGIDLFAETIKLFVGRQPDLCASRSYTAAARWLMVEQNGILQQISGESDARRVPWVTDVKVSVEPGTALVWHGDFGDVLGHIFVASPSAEQTQAALRRALEHIRFTVTPSPAQDEHELRPDSG